MNEHRTNEQRTNEQRAFAGDRVLDLSLCIGLTLDEARTVWRERDVRDEAIEIVESAPPLRPLSVRRENSGKRAPKTPRKPPKAPPTFGQWRVLRVRLSPDQKIEVTVAREEIKSEAPDELVSDFAPAL